MISNSHDILNISISISVIGVAFFICWSLFYIIMFVRQFYKIAKDAREVMDDAGKTMKLLKEKVEASSSYFVIIAEGIKKIMEFMKEKDQRKKRKKKELD